MWCLQNRVDFLGQVGACSRISEVEDYEFDETVEEFDDFEFMYIIFWQRQARRPGL